MTDREIFASNLKQFMAQTKTTQKDIADALGLNRATVSAWITGRGYPRINVIQKLARFFNCQVSDLVVQETHSDTEEDRLLFMFRSLNLTGKAKLMERAEELTVLYGGKSNSISDKQVLNNA